MFANKTFIKICFNKPLGLPSVQVIKKMAGTKPETKMA
jgi:hypothetical protein